MKQRKKARKGNCLQTDQIFFDDILFVEESCPFFFLKSLTPLTRNKRNETQSPFGFQSPIPKQRLFPKLLELLELLKLELDRMSSSQSPQSQQETKGSPKRGSPISRGLERTNSEINHSIADKNRVHRMDQLPQKEVPKRDQGSYEQVFQTESLKFKVSKEEKFDCSALTGLGDQ